MTNEERDKFMSEAGPAHLQLDDGTVIVLHPKRFKSGSVGWYAAGKVKMSELDVQANCCFTVVGSQPGWVPFAQRAVQTPTKPEEEPITPQALFEAPNGSGPVKKPRK